MNEADKKSGNQSGELSGRALDVAVAERVMGWTRCGSREGKRVFENRTTGHHPIFESRLPRYSAGIAAAMEIVGKMYADGWSFACTMYEGQLPYASFCKGTAVSSRNAEASTLPEAICRAAFKATDKEQL